MTDASPIRRALLRVVAPLALCVLCGVLVFGRACGPRAATSGGDASAPPALTPTPDPYDTMATDADPTLAQLGSHTRRLRLVVRVPPDTPPIYIAGSLIEMGNWAAAGRVLEGTGTERRIDFLLPRGTRAEFKFTLGSWENEALLDDGTVPTNFVVEDLQENTTLTFDIRQFGDAWKIPPPDPAEAGLVGRAEFLLDVPSQHLKQKRHVVVWFPPAYDAPAHAGRRFPVLYMHDGQCLFDPRTATTHVDWGVDETIARLADDGLIEPWIVVGTFNTPDRMLEYSPWDQGPAYARFLVEELKPRIDASYRTRPGRDDTAIMGSSMGGLISLYLGWKHPDVFSKVGAVSTHYPHHVGRIIDDIRAAGSYPRDVRIYFDYGTNGLDAVYEAFQQVMTDVLDGFGWRQPDDFIVHRAEGAEHNEAAWRARLDLPLLYLLGTEAAREEVAARILARPEPDDAEAAPSSADTP